MRHEPYYDNDTRPVKYELPSGEIVVEHIHYGCEIPDEVSVDTHDGPQTATRLRGATRRR